MTIGDWIGLICMASLVSFVGGGFCIYQLFFKKKEPEDSAAERLKEHFDSPLLADLVVSKRTFPTGIRADLQRALDQLFAADAKVVEATGVKSQYAHLGLEFGNLLHPSQPAEIIPLEFEELDIGEAEPVKCHGDTLWLLEWKGEPCALLLAKHMSFSGGSDLQFFVAARAGEQGENIGRELFGKLEEAAKTASSYRGKILSLEPSVSYTGHTIGIKVHKLRRVQRDQVILPPKTLDLLDRNVIRFVNQRARLAALGQATKKGLLFYGPPGTGKTHTIHYLAAALEGHTTLLIAAEQVAYLDQYMSLARLYQPSIVVLEDVDLIARDREAMDSPCGEALLNKLLNEMDGLREDANILFLLTTNRPHSLEQALASRPGRVDQAIEFPLPDADGRQKLVRLYSQGLKLSDEMIRDIAARTERVSAAFIKELMRRTLQFHLERDGDSELTRADLDLAIEELLVSGGSLNLKLLGAEAQGVTS
jgi:cell division protease FtsH